MPTDQITLGHHLTLSEEKSSMKWSRYVATDVMDAPEHCSISSNGKGAPKATTHGNQLIKSSLQTY